MNPRWAAVALTYALSAAGCGSLTFTTLTAVGADGGVVRTTRLAARGRALSEELTSRYELPAGGTWTELEPESPTATGEAALPERSYAVTRRFAPEEPVTGDFVRYTAARDAAARNAVSLVVRRSWVADTYSYAETFRDVLTLERFASAFRRVYAFSLEALAAEIASVSSGGVTFEAALGRLGARTEPLVTGFIRAVDRRCMRVETTLERCEEVVGAEPALDYVVGFAAHEDRLLDALAATFAPPPGVGADAWRATLQEAIRRRSERDSEEAMALFENIDEELFGVHGLVLFKDYAFEQTLTLPGELVASNARSSAGGALNWSFDSEAFVLHPLTLRARSRVVRWERVLFLLTTAVALTGILGVSLRFWRTSG